MELLERESNNVVNNPINKVNNELNKNISYILYNPSNNMKKVFEFSLDEESSHSKCMIIIIACWRRELITWKTCKAGVPS